MNKIKPYTLPTIGTPGDRYIFEESEIEQRTYNCVLRQASRRLTPYIGRYAGEWKKVYGSLTPW